MKNCSKKKKPKRHESFSNTRSDIETGNRKSEKDQSKSEKWKIIKIINNRLMILVKHNYEIWIWNEVNLKILLISLMNQTTLIIVKLSA